MWYGSPDLSDNFRIATVVAGLFVAPVIGRKLQDVAPLVIQGSTDLRWCFLRVRVPCYSGHFPERAILPVLLCALSSNQPILDSTALRVQIKEFLLYGIIISHSGVCMWQCYLLYSYRRYTF